MPNNVLGYCVFSLPLFFGTLLFGQTPLAVNSQELASATATSTAPASARRSPSISQIQLRITTTVLLRGIAQVPYSQTIQATGGTAPFTWSVSAGALLPGLTLGSTNGVISGSPASPGATSVTIKVTDSVNATASEIFFIDAVPPVQIGILNQEALPTAVVGKNYGLTLPATGGTLPYFWSVVNPSSMPPGLTLSSSGILSGTPTTIGTFNPTFLLQDSGNYGSICCTGRQVSTAFSITVETPLRIITNTLPDGTFGIPYTTTLLASGGLVQNGRTWSLVSGVLPDGLQLAAAPGLNFDATTIAGTPIRSGVFNFTIQVTNVGSDSVSRAFSIRILAPVQITTVALNQATIGTTFSQTLAVTGGTPPYVWTTSQNPIAPGVSIDASLGVIRGIPTQEGTYNFQVTVRDGQGLTHSRQLSLIVSQPAPQLTVSLPNLSFSHQVGAATPGSQIVFLTSSGTQVGFTAQPSGGSSWLSLNTNSTTAPATLNVSVNPAGLAAGIYNGSILINSPNASNPFISIPVSLTVNSAPSLSASPSQLAFTYQAGNSFPAAKTLSITSNAGSSSLQIDSSAAWLSATPVSTNAPAVIFVSVAPTGLNPGIYNGSVSVSSIGIANSPLTVQVTLTVTAAPTLSASFAQLTFNSTPGGPAPASQSVTISSTIGTTYSIAITSAPWLTISPSSGTISSAAPAHLIVSANPGSLGSGTYNGAIVISGQGILNSPQTLPVSLIISPPAAIAATPSQLAFTAGVGGTPPPTQTASVSAASPVNFTVSTGTFSWLTVVPSSTVTPATLTVGVSAAGLAVGNYTGLVTITAPGSPNSPQTISVNLAVTASQPLAASPSQLTFNYQLNDPAPQPQTIALTGTPLVSFTASAGTSPWLFVTSSSNTSPATLTVTTNPQGLSAGRYTGAITITPAAGSTQTVAVNLTVGSGQVFILNPGQISFSVQSTGTTPPTQTVTISATTPGAFTANTTTPWLSVTPPGGTTPSNITLAANPASLATGSYSGSVTIGGLGSSQLLPVTLTVSQPSPIAVSLSQVTFAYLLGGPAPSSQTVAISTPQPTAFSVNTGGARWLQAAPNRTTTPATLTISINPVGLTLGTLTGTISVAPLSDPSAAQTINVNLAVTAASTPSFSTEGIVNAASFVPGLVPGSIATLFGRNLSSVSGIVLSGGKTSESGTSVKVGDVLAPLLGVANVQGQEQISFQVPFEVQPGTTTVEVANRSGALRIQGVPVFAAQPGIFEFLDNASNAYVAAVVHTDGSLVSATSPARRSEVVSLYFTGGGALRPAVPTGRLAPVPPSITTSPVAIGVSETNCEILFAGYAPGNLGLYQVNFRIPANSPTRLAKLSIRTGNEVGQDSLIPIQ